jgi:predicted nuclease of predicted toxin-antitoxin system
VRIRFQADADLSEDIVSGLLRRESGIDFQTAGEAGLRGLSDAEVLALAAREGRIVVSHDRKTMPGYFAEFLRTDSSPGLFIVSQKTDLATVIEGLVLVWAASEAEEWVDRLVTIPL